MSSEFISDPIQKITDVSSSSERRVAAVAYVTKDHAGFGESDVVICDASDSAIQSRATCRALLRRWYETGVQVYSKQDLHAKMIVFDHESAFVGSANLSNFAERRVESGIFTTEPIVVAECEKFILDLAEKSNIVNEAFLNRIDRLKLKPRPSQKTARKAAGRSTLKYWFFKGTSGHSRKTQEVEDLMRLRWNKSSPEETTEDYEDDIPEDENPLCFDALKHSSSRWCSGVSKGDRIFWCYEHDDYGWIVLPPRTVTEIEKQGKSTMAGTEGRYWDEEQSVRLSVFVDQLGLRKNASLDSIDITDPKLTQLLREWKSLVD